MNCPIYACVLSLQRCKLLMEVIDVCLSVRPFCFGLLSSIGAFQLTSSSGCIYSGTISPPFHPPTLQVFLSECVLLSTFPSPWQPFCSSHRLPSPSSLLHLRVGLVFTVYTVGRGSRWRNAMKISHRVEVTYLDP